MIITFFHIPAPGMGSLLIDSFGKEVGKRKWCETFAGPLARRLSRSGRLSFIFPKEKLIFSCFSRAFFVLFLCFFVLFFVLFRRSRAPKKAQKKAQFIAQQKSTKKAQFIAQKIAQKKAQFIAKKKHKKKHNS